MTPTVHPYKWHPCCFCVLALVHFFAFYCPSSSPLPCWISQTEAVMTSPPDGRNDRGATLIRMFFFFNDWCQISKKRWQGMALVSMSLLDMVWSNSWWLQQNSVKKHSNQGGASVIPAIWWRCHNCLSLRNPTWQRWRRWTVKYKFFLQLVFFFLLNFPGFISYCSKPCPINSLRLQPHTLSASCKFSTIQ